MQLRSLGQTGLKVSAIGLGTEHLLKVPRETVVAVVHAALDRGVNYLDLIWAFPEYRDNFAAALKGRRHQVILAGHLGSALKGSQYKRTRNAPVCQEFFLDLMTRLQTDYIDVAMIHNVNTDKEYQALLGPKGVVELAHRLKREGRARCVAMSGHSVEIMSRAIRDGIVDALMFPVNLSGNAQPGRRALLQACANQGIGLIAMKAFAGGKLFQPRQTVYFAKYQTGGSSFKKKVPPAIRPLQCLHYTLSQPGVSTVIPGVQNMDELRAALAFLDAPAAEKDFAAILSEFEEYATGECVYCNHCLPCPAVIDIGLVSRLVDTATADESLARRDHGVPSSLQTAYDALSAKASACTRCGVCVERCPFEVDVLSIIDRAMELFEIPE